MADRREIAEELVDLHIEHAEVFGKIDDLKEQLRKFAEASVDGPTIDDLKGTLRKLARTIDEGELGIDDLKETLRELGAVGHSGFTEKFAGKGDVAVSGGSESKFKGIMPILDAAAFLAMPIKQRDKLIADKIVTMDHQFTKASRPSVTVKL
jgi:hypothetical protein